MAVRDFDVLKLVVGVVVRVLLVVEINVDVGRVVDVAGSETASADGGVVPAPSMRMISCPD